MVSLPPHQAEKTGKPQQSDPSPITTVIPAFYGRLASIGGLYLGVDHGRDAERKNHCKHQAVYCAHLDHLLSQSSQLHFPRSYRVTPSSSVTCS